MNETTIQSLIVSRGTQLVARYTATALIASGTISASKAQPYAGIIAQYAVAALLVVFDHFIHSQKGSALIAAASAKIQPWLGNISIGDLVGQVANNTATANQALTIATSAASVANAAHAVANQADVTATTIKQLVNPTVATLPIGK